MRSGPAVVITVTGFLTTGLVISGCAAMNTGAAATPSGKPAGGVSSESATPSPAASASSVKSPETSSSADAGAPERCHTSQLSGRVRLMDAAAGNRYARLILTNTSDGECRTYGYVGLQLTGSGDDALPTEVVRESDPGPRRVILRPGDSAYTRIHWTVAPGAGEPVAGQCEPKPSRLLVIPPDERTQLAAGWPGGPVCDRGKIFVTALSPGTG